MDNKSMVNSQTIIVFILSFVVLSALVYIILLQYKKQEKNHYYNIAVNKANEILNSLDIAFYKLYSLNSLLIAYKGDTSFFKDVSKNMYDEIRRYTGISLKNLALAPNGIVTEVYPLSGNEKLVGFNFMNEDIPGNKEAVDSYRNDEVCVSSPFKLVQGNYGMGGMLPIFIPDDNGEKHFWGLVTVTIDFDNLISSLNMESLTKLDTNYCLWYKGADNEDIILAQSDGKISEDAPSYEFGIRNLRWILSISPNKGWLNKKMVILIFVIIFAFSLFNSYLYMRHFV